MIQWWTKKRFTVANQRGITLIELMIVADRRPWKRQR